MNPVPVMTTGVSRSLGAVWGEIAVIVGAVSRSFGFPKSDEFAITLAYVVPANQKVASSAAVADKRTRENASSLFFIPYAPVFYF